MDTHEIVAVTRFEHVGPHCLRLEFDDGAVQTIDFSPILFGQLFGPLRDLDFFNQVSLDPDFHTLVWPNGADFDPSDLRHWPEALPFFLKAAERWKQQASPVH